MKRFPRNPFCVYTGKVGARMRIPIKRGSRRIIRHTFTPNEGPLAGYSLPLDADGGFNTLPLAPMAGHPAGRYEGARWVPL